MRDLWTALVIGMKALGPLTFISVGKSALSERSEDIRFSERERVEGFHRTTMTAVTERVPTRNGNAISCTYQSQTLERDVGRVL